MPVLRRIFATTLLAPALLLSACDYSTRVERRAAYPGGDPLLVRKVLEDDAQIRTRVPKSPGRMVRIGGPAEEHPLWCERDGITANVSVTRGPDEIRVNVGALNRRPSADEARAWTERVEYICTRLSAATPAIGEWEVRDNLEGPNVLLLLAFAGLTCVGVPVAAVFLVLAIVRRRRPPATPR